MANQIIAQPVPGDASDQLCILAKQMTETMHLLPEHQAAIEKVTIQNIDSVEEMRREIILSRQATVLHRQPMVETEKKLDSLTAAIRSLIAVLAEKENRL